MGVEGGLHIVVIHPLVRLAIGHRLQGMVVTQGRMMALLEEIDMSRYLHLQGVEAACQGLQRLIGRKEAILLKESQLVYQLSMST